MQNISTIDPITLQVIDTNPNYDFPRQRSRNASKSDSLVPIAEIAYNLGLKPNTKNFDAKTGYIPVTLVSAKKLFTEKEFQRLIITSFVKGAKEFNGHLARPLFVFLRPSGKYSIADGQHTSILAILYTKQGIDVELPCQVIEHPKDFSEEECIKAEAIYFKKLNKNRRNVGKVDQLRANIALQNAEALIIEDKINDMGVHIEGIGDSTGPEVFGYDKLMEAHEKYELTSVRKAIILYQKIQRDARFCWNDIDKPLNGGLIGGISAVYYLMDNQFLGGGDKLFALNEYLENHLGYTPIKAPKKGQGSAGLIDNTGGTVQSILIARKIVSTCNILIRHRSLKKKNGENLLVEIGDDAMKNAGLDDPTKIDSTKINQ